MPQYASISASWEPYRTSSENINRKQEEQGNLFGKIQKYKNTEIQKYKNTEIQKYINTEIQKYRNIYNINTSFMGGIHNVKGEYY